MVRQNTCLRLRIHYKRLLTAIERGLRPDAVNAFHHGIAVIEGSVVDCFDLPVSDNGFLADLVRREVDEGVEARLVDRVNAIMFGVGLIDRFLQVVIHILDEQLVWAELSCLDYVLEVRRLHGSIHRIFEIITTYECRHLY